jgi:hypothetical protein
MAEILTPTEMNLPTVILRIEISSREEEFSIFKFFFGEGQERIEICHHSHIHYQEGAMKTLFF